MKNIFLIISIITGYNVMSQKISVIPRPQRIYIEQAENKQVINLDFLVSNQSTDTFTLTKIAVSVYKGELIQSRFLDNNGTAPSIMVIPNRKFNGPVAQLIFNPFTDFSPTIPLNNLVYELTFTDNQDKEILIRTKVSPQKFLPKSTYFFPLKGRVLVYDAHDFLSHHRRFDYEFAPIKGLQIKSNFMRYAYDFVLLDEQNNQFKNEGRKDEDYIGFGQPVYAIGSGKVIYASNNHKDDKTFDIPGIATNPLELYGNCIAILHADSSVSIYGHLKQNSIKVKIGDIVIAQQHIGMIGISGSSFFPHLHFEVRSSIKHDAEGIPSYFSNLFLLEGTSKKKLLSGMAETGNILETR